MRLTAGIAGLALCVAVAGCAGVGDDALSIEEARDKPPSEVVRVRGPVVVQYGEAMICTELTEDSPPQCEAGLWLGGPSRQLDEQELELAGGVQWSESVVLEGTVDGGGSFILAP
jgi:hypothetical protein